MERIAFNDGWMIYQNGGSSLNAIFDRGSTAPIPVTLPHDASIRLPRTAENHLANGNGYFQEITCHYTKNFELDEKYAEKKAWLEFEGVYQNAYVYINGSFAGKHHYGYGNFFIDATPHLKFGEKNFIDVIVKNGVNSGRWYTGCGIYRKVSLIFADRLHFDVSGVKARAVEIEKDFAEIEIKANIHNGGLGLRQIYFSAGITDPEGNEAGWGKMRISLPEGEGGEYRLKLYVKNPRLWDAESPQLYGYEASILEGEEIIDFEKGNFGIRKIQTDPFNGLRINGESVKLRGGCIHHDNGIIGAEEYKHAARERIRCLKEAGYNAVRSSHYPISKELLLACDELGMYVIDEYSDVWTSSKVDFDYGMHAVDCWEEDIKNMVDKAYNHPCVIMYSIGNEIMELSSPYDVQWGKKFADYIRRLDYTRPVTNGINPAMLFSGQISGLLAEARAENAHADKGGAKAGGAEEIPSEINTVMNFLGSEKGRLLQSEAVTKGTEEAAGQLDVLGYNYAAERYEVDGERYPNRVLFGSETMAKDLDKNWTLVERLPHVIGDFVWTAWDYLGEPGIGHTVYEKRPKASFYMEYPYKSAYCGDIDIIGTRRAVSYWRETIWRKTQRPYLFVQPPAHHGDPHECTGWGFSDALRSWTFSGQEDKPVTVEIYANAEEAELCLNGKTLERKKIGDEKKNIAYFETIYRPGTLSLIVYQGGVELGRDELKTALHESTQLCAIADRTEIPADGSDIAYINLALRDEAGVLNMDIVKKVRVSVSGPGTVIGYGSADPKSEENYYDAAASTYEGRLRAAVRGTGEKGLVTMNFETENGDKKTVSIMAV